ncbi:HAD-IA family hydrolase [Streptomyces sp. NBC_01244]|uniref:HAD-IA family hydrolase n=1 Tax=Streptomyces sp. NBC_01244 TaxID=2903797 RepID=UPI002E134185|nr:HAD-IA family hydrolase [Streptomyces sp. NBC_01244]
MTSPIRGLLVDVDGVLRLWPRRSAIKAALDCGLPEQAVRRVAYDGGFDLAHHGVWSHEQWVDQVTTRLTEEFGAAGKRAAELWAADRGDADPAMADLLRRARAAGLVICALTNNTTVVAADLELHGLADVFDHVANSAEIRVTKPAPGAYEAALALMDLPAGQVAFTDDSRANVTAALHVGLHAHHYTRAEEFERFLADLGITLPPAAGQPAARVAGVPAGTAPPAGHAEADEATTVATRYLATGLPPAVLADRLAAHDPALTVVPLGPDALATVNAAGTLTTWRLLPHSADPRAAAGHVDAWAEAAGDVDAEHLPPWLPATRAAAAGRADDLLHHTGWALYQLAAADAGGDPLAAATHLDTVRQHLTVLATLLLRHQKAPWPGATASRYLTPTIREALTASLRADPTARAGLAAGLRPLLGLLRHLRQMTQLVLDTTSAWPWPHTAASLAPLLDGPPDLTAQALEDPLYTPALAAVYDRHRPLAQPMADALRIWAATELSGCDVVELGAGTGRITRQLAGPGPASYRAIEPSIAMAAHLRNAHLAGVEVVEADALLLPLPALGADVVVEHEALQFAADPLLAADEALRVLRPGGRLVRLLLHPTGPHPLAGIDAAYRQAAFADGPRPLFFGKGTDQRITAHLAARGRPTQNRTLAEFIQHRTVEQALAALADRAWPYQHQLTDPAHQDGMAAARQEAARLPKSVSVPYVLRALITPADQEDR